jgi:hypothetical protein
MSTLLLPSHSRPLASAQVLSLVHVLFLFGIRAEEARGGSNEGRRCGASNAQLMVTALVVG